MRLHLLSRLELANKRLGNEVEKNALVVDNIPREKSDKFKFFKTYIPS